MSLIRKETIIEREINRVFDEKLMSLAQKSPDGFLDLNEGQSQRSFFKEYTGENEEYTSMERVLTENALKDFFKREGNGDFVALASEIYSLILLLKESQQKEDTEVNPFIYAMF